MSGITVEQVIMPDEQYRFPTPQRANEFCRRLNRITHDYIINGCDVKIDVRGEDGEPSIPLIHKCRSLFLKAAFGKF